MISDDDILNATIIIVDDQETNVLLLKQMLIEAGYRHITSTMDPHTVCALYHQHHFDLILLDLQMPGMDGFQVMERLRDYETDGYLPILAITAQPGHMLRALTEGAKDYISKPFNLMEARTRIHNMLEVRLLYKQLEQYSRTLESLAMHDALTTLPNRRLLMDRLSLSIAHARRNKGTMAIMYLDLDGFKKINDTLGHDAGDSLLKMVAARMVATVRQEDTVARIAGDEFVIVLHELNHTESIIKLASKMIQVISEPYHIRDNCMNITASIGIGIYPTHGKEVATLMKSADLALYEAKRTGKNVYRIATRDQFVGSDAF